MKQSKDSEKQERLYLLDGMRGVAALIVALGHLGARTHQIILEGYLAVDFFFLLSGLVIAINYSAKLRSGMRFITFMEKRIIRLYPLYIAGLTLGCAKYIAELIIYPEHIINLKKIIAAIALNALMLPNLTSLYDSSGILFPLNPPAWSLFYEMVVNIIFAAVLYKASSKILLLVAVLSAAMLLLVIGSPLFFNVGWGWANAIPGGARVFFAFPLGVVMFRAFNVLAPKQSNASLMFLIILTCLLVVPIPQKAIYEFSVVFLIVPLLIVAGMRLQPFGYSRSVCAFLGDISYPVYALHFPLLAIFTPGMIDKMTPFGSYLALLLILPLFGWVAYRFYDSPVRRLLNSMLSSSRLFASRSIISS